MIDWKKINWPDNCIWPMPLDPDEFMIWDEDDVIDSMDVKLDPETKDHLEIWRAIRECVDDGLLEDETCLFSDDCTEDDEARMRKIPGSAEYWTPAGFDIESWQNKFMYLMNRLKIDNYNGDGSVIDLERAIGYIFINQNLLRQAVTRRSFAVQAKLDGCAEELEFIGDSILNSIVTREIVHQLTSLDVENTPAPFKTSFNEGSLTKIRSHFVSKEYLASRAEELGIGRFILYGNGEAPSESSLEDTLEAIIGAVAIDCGWDYAILEDVVDTLLCLQVMQPDELLKQTYYEVLNAWHQKHFGEMPDYSVYRYPDHFQCTVIYKAPSDTGAGYTKNVKVQNASTRSKARELAAGHAYYHLVKAGLWINLKDSGITPDFESSINQLQELYQKKYVSLPEYTFKEDPSRPTEVWSCTCNCSGRYGYGKAETKIKAKKKAAYMTLCRLFSAAGLGDTEQKDTDGKS